MTLIRELGYFSNYINFFALGQLLRIRVHGGGAHKSNGELVTKISENPSETRRISAGQNFRRGCKKFSSFQTGEEYPDMISSDI